MSDEQLRKKALAELMFDPLSVAEKITGRQYSDDAGTFELTFDLKERNSLRKRAILSEIGDTYRGISWQKFLQIILSLGFEITHKKRRVIDRGDGIVVSPTDIIAAHNEKILILFAGSYVPTNPKQDELLDGGKICGSIDVSGLEEGIDWYQFLGQINFSFYGDKMQFYFGVAEALVTRLQLVETTAPLCDWPQEDEPTIIHTLLQDKASDLPDWTKEFMDVKEAEGKK